MKTLTTFLIFAGSILLSSCFGPDEVHPKEADRIQTSEDNISLESSTFFMHQVDDNVPTFELTLYAKNTVTNNISLPAFIGPIRPNNGDWCRNWRPYAEKGTTIHFELRENILGELNELARSDEYPTVTLEMDSPGAAKDIISSGLVKWSEGNACSFPSGTLSIRRIPGGFNYFEFTYHMTDSNGESVHGFYWGFVGGYC